MSVRSAVDDNDTWTNKDPLSNTKEEGYNYFDSLEFRQNYDQLQHSMRCCSFLDNSAISIWESKRSKIKECNGTGQCDSCFPNSCYVKSKIFHKEFTRICAYMHTLVSRINQHAGLSISYFFPTLLITFISYYINNIFVGDQKILKQQGKCEVSNFGVRNMDKIYGVDCLVIIKEVCIHFRLST